MRSILVFLSALLILNVSFSQSPKQHILDRVSIGFGLRQSVKLGNHIFSIGENESVTQSYPSLVSQDLELNTEWIYHPVRPNTTSKYLDQLIASSDDNLIMAGSADDDLWLLKMDTIGNILWEKELETAGDQYPNSFIPNNVGGGVLFALEWNSSDNNIQVINFDNNGDTLWTSKISSTIGTYYRQPVGIWDSNNDLIINLRNGFMSEVVKIDGTNGQLLEHYKFQDDLGADYYFRSVYNDGQNTYFAGAMNSGSYTSVVLKLDASQNILWTKNYPEIGRFFGLTKDLNGDIYLQGSTAGGSDLNLVQLLKIDEDGNPIKAKSYGKKPAAHLVLSNFMMINNTLTISGWRDYQAAKTAYQLTVDTDLNSGSCYEREFEVSSIDVISSRFDISGVSHSSIFTSVLFAGTPTNTSYITAGTSSDYNLDNYIFNNFNVIGDDCGGSCSGSIETLSTGGDPGYNYLWSNGQTNSIATGLCAGDSYSVRVGDQLGCFSYDTILIPQMANVTEICMVSVDSSSSKNEIVWDKPISGAIEGFGVYREVVGNYNLIGYVDYDSLSRFVDFTNGVNPNITSYRYKISTFDTCGNESALSNYHETIHLTVNQGAGTDMNCIWDGYEGFPFSYNRILRDSTGTGDWEVVDSVSSSVFTWTDVDAPTVPSRYIIEIVIPNNCDATKAVSYGSTRSNKQSIFGGGGADPLSISQENELSIINVYPNPTKGDFWIEMSSAKPQMVSIDLLDVTGKIVLRKEFEIVGQSKHILKLNDIDPAVYLLKITTENSMTTKAIIKN